MNNLFLIDANDNLNNNRLFTRQFKFKSNQLVTYIKSNMQYDNIII